METVTETLSLDVPRVQRYLNWLHRLVFEPINQTTIAARITEMIVPTFNRRMNPP